MITYRGFAKRYGPVVAVAGLDLEIGKGEIVALLGPNGSGKTTALKAAAGLLRPSAGEVLLGHPGRSASQPEARRLISFLPQKVAFPEGLSGREALELYRRLRGVREERTLEVLRFANLNGAGARAVTTYSGGMLQRLGLAVALLPEAPVLLLDEPTAALDPTGLTAFYDAVARHREAGRTVLFTSHQLGDVERIADRFAVLVEGQLVTALSQRELADRLADRGVIRLRLARGALASGLAGVQRLAAGARVEGDELVVPCRAAQRGAVIELLRTAGIEVLGLATEEGRLDGFYRQLMEETR